MRNIILLLMIFIAVLTVSLSISIANSEKAKKEIDRLSLNLDQYGLALSTLNLSKAEIAKELEKKNATLMETDSILKSKNKRISQLESLVKTRIVIRDNDTVYIPLVADPVPVVPIDTSYHPVKYNFSQVKNCITVGGYLTSADPRTKLFVTERTADIKVYDIYIKRKWYQIFKPKYERIVESNCGDVSIEKIYKSAYE